MSYWTAAGFSSIVLIVSVTLVPQAGASQEVTFRRLHQAAAVASAGGAAASAGGATAVASTTYLPVPASPSSINGLDGEVFDTIEAALEALPELSIFFKLIKEILGNKIKFIKTILTLFCPTNSAFAALAETIGMGIEELISKPVIKQIILYHILPEIKTIAEFAVGEFIETLLQGELGIKLDVVQAIAEILPTGGPPADVILKDIKAGEAILHVISGVLIPSTKVAELERLLSLAESIVGEAAG